MLFASGQLFGRNNIDSLWNVWSDTTQTDSVRLISINTIVRQNYLFALPDSAYIFAQKQFEFAESVNNKNWMAAARNIQGVAFHIQGNYHEAIIFYNKSLKIAEEIEDKKTIASSVNNIGIIYKEQQNYEKAISYFNKSFKLKKEIGDKIGVANALGNLGGVYSSTRENDKALDYYNRGLKILEQTGNDRGISGFLNNIGTIFQIRGDHAKALEYFNKSLKLREKIGDKRGQASCLKNIAELHRTLGNYNEALKFANKGLRLAKESNALAEEMENSIVLYNIYKSLGDFTKALEMHELYIFNRDSLNSDKNRQEVIRQEYKYEYEKKYLSDSLVFVKEQEINEIKIAKQQAEIKAKRNQQYGLYGGLVLLLIFATFIYNRFKVTQKQKIVIEHQKKIVDEKNEEILDSITYAKRIQNAILPTENIVKEYLKNSFILYKPKDIVAGDFYWMESLSSLEGGLKVGDNHPSNSYFDKLSTGSQGENIILFAAADCTGHGVPGAMVSVVCHNALNRSVREHGLTDPGEILNKTREIVVQEFEKSDEKVQDGMDIALCSLRFLVQSSELPESTISSKPEILNSNPETVAMLQYAGANNPLWIIRIGEIMETSANKQPIGKFDDPEPYTTHIFELKKNDSIYIFSDGYVDQFGGEYGKKYKVNAYRKLLLSIQDKSMQEQRELINKSFESWKGNLEQVDDVCIIGVRI